VIRSSSLPRAYSAAVEVLRNATEGTFCENPWNPLDLATAKGAAAYFMATNERSPDSLASAAYWELLNGNEEGVLANRRRVREAIIRNSKQFIDKLMS